MSFPQIVESFRTSWVGQVVASVVGAFIYQFIIDNVSFSEINNWLSQPEEDFEVIIDLITSTFHTFLYIYLSIFIVTRGALYADKMWKQHGLVEKSGLIQYLDNEGHDKDREKIELQLKESLSNEHDIRLVGATGLETFGKDSSFLHEIISNPKGSVEILLLDPDLDNPGLKYRADQLDTTPEAFQAEIITSIELLRSLKKQNKHITLYLYHHPPQWKLYVTGEKLWIQYYQQNKHVNEGDLFGFERSSNGKSNFYDYFLNVYNRKIEKLKSNQHEVNLDTWNRDNINTLSSKRRKKSTKKASCSD